MTKQRPLLEYPSKKQGTKIGNGSALLEGVDGRSTAARRYREVYSTFAALLSKPQPGAVVLLRQATTLHLARTV